jgi:hypothetical protein
MLASLRYISAPTSWYNLAGLKVYFVLSADTRYTGKQYISQPSGTYQPAQVHIVQSWGIINLVPGVFFKRLFGAIFFRLQMHIIPAPDVVLLSFLDVLHVY